MPFTGIYDLEQVAMLYKVLDDHCAKFRIERSTREHEDAVYLVMSLFERGAHTAGELSAALDDVYRTGDEGPSPPPGPVHWFLGT